jgi:hypothetical protein
MKEAKLREVNWPDVNRETFIRLCEFAYLQDYTPPAFEQRPYSEDSMSPAPEVTALKNHEFWDGWDGWTSSQRRKKEREGRKRGIPARLEDITPEPEPEPYPEPEPEPYPESEPAPAPAPESEQPEPELPFKERDISDGDLRREFLTLQYIPTKQTHRFNTTGNTGPSQDFTPVFLGHAELYVLADIYGIEPLRQLILYKLRQTMGAFTIYEENVASIIEFVRFVYQNTPSRNGEIDSLRKLTTHYVASVLGQIGDREDFGELLVEGGEFVMDLWRTIRNAG